MPGQEWHKQALNAIQRAHFGSPHRVFDLRLLSRPTEAKPPNLLLSAGLFLLLVKLECLVIHRLSEFARNLHL